MRCVFCNQDMLAEEKLKKAEKALSSDAVLGDVFTPLPPAVAQGDWILIAVDIYGRYYLETGNNEKQVQFYDKETFERMFRRKNFA